MHASLPSCMLCCAVTCMGGVGINGVPLDICIKNGTICGTPAADAFCRFLGTHLGIMPLSRCFDEP